MTIKNRGAFSNPEGRFDIHLHESYDDGWDNHDEEALPPLETVLYPEAAKSIITRNDSPDLGFEQSINPYRGCEHGCIYCYARPSHAYMNLSPGLDFETKIFYKQNPAELLEKEINKPKYICKPIMLGANTDPYQPAEAKLQVTRKILEVLHAHYHPVAIISKNSMIERDIDLLSEMAKKGLVSAAISMTTLSTELKRILEPRTSSPKARLRAVKNLSEAGIPVRVMAAPMIPMINDMELEKILKLSAKAGAKQASYVLIRLPHEVKDLFREWLQNHFPARASHVMSIIQQMRGGKDYDAQFGKRMRGEGEFADLLGRRFKLACQRFKLNQMAYRPLRTDLFKKKNLSPQLDLWG
jgi:DNA repair photolyase